MAYLLEFRRQCDCNMEISNRAYGDCTSPTIVVKDGATARGVAVVLTEPICACCGKQFGLTVFDKGIIEVRSKWNEKK